VQPPEVSLRSSRIGFSLGEEKVALDQDWWTRNPWCGAVFGGILKRKLECGLNPSLELCPAEGGQGFAAVIDLSLDEIPIHGGALEGPLRVHLNPPHDQACVNFASPDYFVCSRVLGHAWRVSGRRRILLLASARLADSVSSRLRYSGLLCGLGEAIGTNFEVRVLKVSSAGIPGGEEIGPMIDETGWVPDAVYCIGDIQARGVVQALTARGLSIPREVSVIGGCKTESVYTGLQPLTSMAHPLDAVGSALIDMVLLRLERGGQDVPGVFIPVPFSIGATTLPEENEILAAHSRELLARRGVAERLL